MKSVYTTSNDGLTVSKGRKIICQTYSEHGKRIASALNESINPNQSYLKCCDKWADYECLYRVDTWFDEVSGMKVKVVIKNNYDDGNLDNWIAAKDFHFECDTDVSLREIAQALSDYDHYMVDSGSL